ncbi:transposase, MuDR, MULE transposase domain protein [Tanacetum coccineum]|uniref:Transposase, MuDR, MULE transposase domain protein n=1 Tax=Tanacetum coccineum TaxID=301880 RepID=A0ABQ5CDA2_9ASTR
MLSRLTNIVEELNVQVYMTNQACSLSHTDSEVEALVQKLIDEDKGRQNAILDLALQFENSCTAKDDLRKAYEKCNDISQESRASIDTFLKEGSDKDYELNLSMYGKAAKLEKQMDAKLTDLYLTEKELHQLHLDEEALRETLEEKAMDEKARKEKIRQKQAEDDEFFLEFGVSSSARVEPSPSTPNPVRVILGPAGVVQFSSSTRVEPSPSTLNPVRIIPGPAGIIQQAKLLKEKDILLGWDEAVMSTQEYMQKVVEDVDEDDDFKSGSWISATEYVNANGGTMSGCLGDIDNNLKKGKLDQVVTIYKSCSPNMLGDLTVTMKDLSGTIPGIVHYKVIGEGGYGNDITVEAAMILANVSVFSPKSSMHHLNITKKNVVKVFRKDTVPGSGSG